MKPGRKALKWRQDGRTLPSLLLCDSALWAAEGTFGSDCSMRLEGLKSFDIWARWDHNDVIPPALQEKCMKANLTS